MSKHITLRYPNVQADALKINYSMEQQGDLHTLYCTVELREVKPEWLQSCNFRFVSLKKKSHYSLLFEESKYNKNLETLLFMDEVYATIMRQARYPVDQ